MAVAGCTPHPLVDDVSPIPTEEIVRSARCEVKLGVLDEVQRRLETQGVTVDVHTLLTRSGRQAASKKPPQELEPFFEEYAKVGVAYDFEFEITEHNHAEAGIGFKLPFTSPASLDLGASAALNKIRTGKRTFSAQETFGAILDRDDWCKDFKARRKNIIYPITGSIGLRKVVNTFIAISEQGGAKDSFVDALSFTTTISGAINPTVKLNPVSNSFRLVSATGSVSADRTDLHKVKVSLAFPVAEKPKKKDGILLPVDPNEKGAAPYVYNPVWRARYNICVADARDREDAFKKLRQSPPEIYCIEYADTFVPRYSPDTPPRISDGRSSYDQPGRYYRYDRRDDGGAAQPPPERRPIPRQPRVWWW